MKIVKAFHIVVSLSMIKFFGDLIEDDSEIPTEVASSSITKFDYTNKPSFCTFIEAKEEKFNHGLLTNAMKIYGPRLAGLINVNYHSEEGNFFHEIWGSSNSTYISKASHSSWDHTISFYFPYHEIFVSDYHISSAKDDGIRNWAIIGCQMMTKVL